MGVKISKPFFNASATNCASAHSPRSLSGRRGKGIDILLVCFRDKIHATGSVDFRLDLALMRRLAVGSDLYLDADESPIEYTNNIGDTAFCDARTIYVLRSVIGRPVVDSVCCAPANVLDVVKNSIR